MEGGPKERVGKFGNLREVDELELLGAAEAGEMAEEAEDEAIFDREGVEGVLTVEVLY